MTDRKRFVIIVLVLVLFMSIFIYGQTYFVKHILPNLNILSPKDLMVEYSQADFKSALDKTGISIYISTDIDADNIGSESTEGGKGQLVDIQEGSYDWDFTNFEYKEFVLTNSEASAFLNDLAPAVLWYENIQVRANTDGSMEASASINVKKMIRQVLPEGMGVIGDFPNQVLDYLLTTVGKINVYSKGSFRVVDNKVRAYPEVFMAGPVELVQYMYKDKDKVDISHLFYALFDAVPGLSIDLLEADTDGGFIFKGVLPQQINIQPTSP